MQEDQDQLHCPVCGHQDQWVSQNDRLIKMEGHLSKHRAKQQKMLQQLAKSLEVWKEIQHSVNSSPGLKTEAAQITLNIRNNINKWLALPKVPQYHVYLSNPFQETEEVKKLAERVQQRAANHKNQAQLAAILKK